MATRPRSFSVSLRTGLKDWSAHESLPFNTRLMYSTVSVSLFSCVLHCNVSLLHRLIRHEESEVWITSQSLWNYVPFFLAFVGSFTPPPAFLLCVWASLRAGSISRYILFVRECVTHNTGIFVFFTLFNQKRQTSLIAAELKLLFTGHQDQASLFLSFLWGTVWF